MGVNWNSGALVLIRCVTLDKDVSAQSSSLPHGYCEKPNFRKYSIRKSKLMYFL